MRRLRMKLLHATLRQVRQRSRGVPRSLRVLHSWSLSLKFPESPNKPAILCPTPDARRH